MHDEVKHTCLVEARVILGFIRGEPTDVIARSDEGVARRGTEEREGAYSE